jgi:hypothetical protein
MRRSGIAPVLVHRNAVQSRWRTIAPYGLIFHDAR